MRHQLGVSKAQCRTNCDQNGCELKVTNAADARHQETFNKCAACWQGTKNGLLVRSCSAPCCPMRGQVDIVCLTPACHRDGLAAAQVGGRVRKVTKTTRLCLCFFTAQVGSCSGGCDHPRGGNIQEQCKAGCDYSASTPTATPPPRPAPPPPTGCTSGTTTNITTTAVAVNVYEKRPGVGGWGGQCTCPDGQVYDVGDNNDNCASLACVGGVSSACSSGGIQASAQGMAVTCAVGQTRQSTTTTNTSTTTPPVSACIAGCRLAKAAHKGTGIGGANTATSFFQGPSTKILPEPQVRPGKHTLPSSRQKCGVKSVSRAWGPRARAAREQSK